MQIDKFIIKRLYEIAKSKNDAVAMEHLSSLDPSVEDPSREGSNGLVVTYADERVLRLLKKRTRKRDSFAIISGIDKENKQNKYKELFSLISDKTKTHYSVEGIFIGLIFYHLVTAKDANSAFLACDLSKEDALEIGRKIGAKFIVWKDATFFGILRCADGAVERAFGKGLADLSNESEDARALTAMLMGNYEPEKTFALDNYFFQFSQMNLKIMVK